MLGPTGNQGPSGPQGGPGVTGPLGPTGNAGPSGPQGGVGITGPDGPAGSAGNAIVFDTDSTINSDSGTNSKADLVRSFRGTNQVLTNDVYWHVQSGRVFQYQGGNVTTQDVSFTELTTDAQGGFLSADAISVSSSSNRVEIRSDRIEVYASGQLRVKIGNLA